MFHILSVLLTKFNNRSLTALRDDAAFRGGDC
jgi:hypothetical protein